MNVPARFYPKFAKTELVTHRAMKRIISTSAAPAAVGPYSQGVEASGATLYVSGQLPIDPADGTMPDTVEQQTEQALRNVEAILREAGYSLSDVVKSVVLLADMNDFAAMNSVYARFYAKDMPARVCYEVGRLPMGARVEIETIAVK